MPRPGMQWRHVVLSTHNSWLPGDPRGFRAVDHKIHSSGDYKNPPPPGEHAGLHRYAKKISGASVLIAPQFREIVGRAIIADLQKRDCRILAVAVAATHMHLLCELPESPERYRDIVGRCKTAACYAMKQHLPGRIWGRYATYKLIRDESHQHNTFAYILAQKDAWTWSFRQGLQDEEETIEVSAKESGADGASP